MVRLQAVERRVENLQQDVATVAVTMREGFQQLREEMRFGFAEMRQEMRARFAQVDGRLGTMDGRLGTMDGRLDSMDGRLDGLTDIVQRIYAEHGQRLKDLEDHVTRA
ncbi:MAG: hypothetical protein ACREUC_07210 [Steroidobacteraceae bacterium]